MFISNYYRVHNDVKAIQLEILNNGPVQTTFLVHTDFLTYKSGIYTYVQGEEEGGHSVKIIGWGT
jgi:cathepsin B